MSQEKLAFARGILACLNDAGVDPATFYKVAFACGHPNAVAAANALAEAVGLMEKEAVASKALIAQRLAARGGPVIQVPQQAAGVIVDSARPAAGVQQAAMRHQRGLTPPGAAAEAAPGFFGRQATSFGQLLKEPMGDGARGARRTLMAGGAGAGAFGVGRSSGRADERQNHPNSRMGHLRAAAGF